MEPDFHRKRFVSAAGARLQVKRIARPFCAGGVWEGGRGRGEPRFFSGYKQPKFLEDTKLHRPVNGSSGRIGGDNGGGRGRRRLLQETQTAWAGAESN